MRGVIEICNILQIKALAYHLIVPMTLGELATKSNYLSQMVPTSMNESTVPLMIHP